MKYERKALQDRTELDEFIKLIKTENVRSYLEIGSKYGGSLWYIGSALPAGSRIVSVDLPHGDHSFKEALPYLKQCCGELSNRGHKVELIIGDSTDPAIVAQVAERGPYDLCFIDANHTEPYVRADWKNYGPLARMVAFHDISDDVQRPPHKFPIQVAQVWNEIKAHHRHREIRNIAGSPHQNGIGILWKTSTS